MSDDAGSIWYHALSNFGKEVGGGFESAIAQYKKRHDELQKFDADFEQMANVADPKDPTGEKKFIDPKSYERIKMLTDKQRYGEEQKMIEAYKFASVVGMNAQKLKEASLKPKAEEVNIEAKKAQTKATQSRKKLTDVQIAQNLGLIPKPQQPPTGGQIAADQRSQRKERMAERADIESRIITSSNKQIVDPEMLLNDEAISYGTKGMLGFKKADDPEKATHVQIEDGPLMTKQKFSRLRKEAEKWRELGKSPDQIPNVPPQASQLLISNPTPEIRAFFDQKYGKGASDTILKAVQPSKQKASAPDTEDDSEE